MLPSTADTPIHHRPGAGLGQVRQQLSEGRKLSHLVGMMSVALAAPCQGGILKSLPVRAFAFRLESRITLDRRAAIERIAKRFGGICIERQLTLSAHRRDLVVIGVVRQSRSCGPSSKPGCEVQFFVMPPSVGL
jgi:hypothetical protein